MTQSESLQSAPESDAKRRALLKGAAYMVAGCAFVTMNDAAMKELVVELPLGQTVAIRSWIGCLLLLLLAPIRGGIGRFKPKNLQKVALLAGLLVASMFLFPWSLRYIPLADAILLAYTSPIIVAMMSPIILKEAVGWRRWTAVIVGLIGAALIIDPQGGNVSLAFAAPLMVAVLVAFRDLLTRRYILGESIDSFVLVMNLMAALVGTLTLVMGWLPMTVTQWVLITFAGAALTLGQYFMVAALQLAEAAAMVSLKYSSVIWATLFGWMFWDEFPSGLDWIGAVLITVSCVVIIQRGAKRRKLTRSQR